MAGLKDIGIKRLEPKHIDYSKSIPQFKVTGSATFGQFIVIDSTAGNINLKDQAKIVFDNDASNTYIAANTDNPEDLEIHADQDILLRPDADVRIKSGDDEYATFIGSGNKLELKNDLDGEYKPLTIWNQSNANDTTGKVSINYYLGDTSDNSVHAGKILVGKEQAFTSTSTTQDSSMEFHTCLNGTVSNKMTLSSAGNLSLDGDITLTNQSKITFDSADTYIAANADDPEDLEIHSDQDILLKPDADVRIHAGDNEYATFIGSGKKLELFNDLDGEYRALTLWNKSNAADTTGKVSINYYLNDFSNNSVHSGKILVGKEQSFTSTTATRDSFMEFHTVLDGTLASKMRITSDGQVGIGTTTPRHKLDVPDIGGLVISYVALENGSNQTFDVTTTMTNIASTDQDAKITFIAPSSGKVELQISAYLADTVGTAQVLSMSIGTDSTYNSGNSSANEKTVHQTDESDDVIINTSWVLTGLSAGSTYTYYIAAKSSANSNHTFYWGNTRQPFIIRAVTLPSTIVTDN